ncbi:hypothetical protein ACJIZ3_010819 [Penstemon smallii]|uniref:Uncharacterized protein n=1 Tax=Penstemon smallii TaxID=265156 RepID=A0ABD3UIS8_9LAMI
MPQYMLMVPSFNILHKFFFRFLEDYKKTRR